MTGFSETGRQIRFEGLLIGVDEVEFSTPDGGTMTREVVTHMGAVVVVPFDGDNVYLIRQFRAAIAAEILELPAGKRDVPGEAPEVTALRECIEEVGMEPARVELLQRFWNSPGFCTEYSHLFVATDLTPRAIDPQGPEEVAAEIIKLPVRDALAMVHRGEIEDAKTAIGLYAFESWLSEGGLGERQA